MDELLTLKWQNHSTVILNLISNLLSTDLYCDATIFCFGKYYQVHKLVLSTCSEYFKDIFDQIKYKHPFIILSDIKPPEMEALLDFMYKGEVNVQQKSVSSLIMAAQSLKIKGLAAPDEEKKHEKFEVAEKRKIMPVSPVLKSKQKRLDVNYDKSPQSTFEKSVTSNNALLDQIETGISYIDHMERQSDLSEEDLAVFQEKSEEIKLELCEGLEVAMSDEINLKHEDIHDGPSNLEDPLSGVEPVTSVPSQIYPDREMTGIGTEMIICNNESNEVPYVGVSDLEDFHSPNLFVNRRMSNQKKYSFSCSMCSFTACFQSKMKEHLYVHTKEKPFQCSNCDYKTCRKRELKRHHCVERQ